MREATLKDWQELCKQAVIERDPVRLLKLFLKIDRLHSHGTLKPWREPPASHATQQIPCPYCSALLEPQEQIVDHNVFRCPGARDDLGRRISTAKKRKMQWAKIRSGSGPATNRVKFFFVVLFRSATVVSPTFTACGCFVYPQGRINSESLHPRPCDMRSVLMPALNLSSQAKPFSGRITPSPSAAEGPRLVTGSSGSGKREVHPSIRGLHKINRDSARNRTYVEGLGMKGTLI